MSSPQLNNNVQVTPTNVNGVGTLFTVNQNQVQSQNQDTYGSPQGNVITGTNIGGTNINSFGRGNVDPGLTNSVSASLTFPTSSPAFNNVNNNLNTFNNGNNLNLQQSANNPFLGNNNNLITG